MSSAILTEHEAAAAGRPGRQTRQDGRPALETRHTAASAAAFHPWHFFVLLSLGAATVAVLVAGPTTPENLVLLSIVIGAAGLAGMGMYRTLAPLASADAALLPERLSPGARAALEREKRLVLRSIKELEFDRAMGKLSAQDFDEMAGRLRARALALMKQLDDGRSAYRALIERELAARIGQAAGPAAVTAPARPPVEAVAAAPPRCASCATSNDADAVFCKQCGARLEGPHP
ncbi:MAG TPA: zinc ribbon domain-containing protein [Vicinamibacterales bacterium]|nr:zinc ribbon domain-containing protein [Vicinamibacterales bacterium]